MKKSKKIAIIVAVALVVIGLIISFAALVTVGFNFKNINTVNFETKTYSVDESFTGISVKGTECDIRLLVSEDDSCKVVCSENDKFYHSVTVNNSTLTIDTIDARRWYEHIGIYLGKPEIVVYLPQTEYEDLYVLSLSGDIDIPKDFSFTEAEICNTSGNVNFMASVENDLSVKTVSGDLYVGGTEPKSIDAHSTSGDVTVASVKTEAGIKAKSVSGNIRLTDIECKNAVAESTSGSVVFSKVIASENININSVSGYVNLLGCDADSLWIKTTSGDVCGSFLTEKIFFTDTVSGHIDVPRSVTGGSCEIKTVSGNIRFTIE